MVLKSGTILFGLNQGVKKVEVEGK